MIVLFWLAVGIFAGLGVRSDTDWGGALRLGVFVAALALAVGPFVPPLPPLAPPCGLSWPCGWGIA